jgi:hypothetical protein
MQKFLAYVQDTSGNALSSASVQVNRAGAGTATIYSDNGVTPKTNPILSAGDGSYWFYAANGKYDVVITKTGYSFNPTETTNLQLYDPTGVGSTLMSPDGTIWTLTVDNGGILSVSS